MWEGIQKIRTKKVAPKVYSVLLRSSQGELYHHMFVEYTQEDAIDQAMERSRKDGARGNLGIMGATQLSLEEILDQTTKMEFEEVEDVINTVQINGK